VWIRPRAGTNQFRNIRQGPFRAIRIEPRTDVEHPGVQTPGDVGVLAIVGNQPIKQIQAGHGPCNLGSVDIAIHPQGGLILVFSRLETRNDRQPDVPAFVALADAREAHQLRIDLRNLPQDAGEIGVAVVDVEARAAHA
jgi:hypothetical protein